jgi:hypothetical protein
MSETFHQEELNFENTPDPQPENADNRECEYCGGIGINDQGAFCNKCSKGQIMEEEQRKKNKENWDKIIKEHKPRKPLNQTRKIA